MSADDEQATGEPGLARRALDQLPALLASTPVIVLGVGLFGYLVVFAGIATLLGHPDAVSTNAQLILGNYTNVSSSVGAGVAAGASVHAARRHRRTHALMREAHRLAEETHALLNRLHGD
ncbi:hypothetical protein [Nocardia sp. NPDC046763]|uniref:hypothetical protein n=1 Tax=Nocardia sp. NPDC046763 TaxID=3155256 RepID=UPI0033C31DD0